MCQIIFIGQIELTKMAYRKQVSRDLLTPYLVIKTSAVVQNKIIFKTCYLRQNTSR